ncbi:MAG: DUF4282 domain-containing protein [Planctomycetes bacterium]|nr:DUF4282 domain-containing protein [Planctomycetota bacterium]
MDDNHPQDDITVNYAPHSPQGSTVADFLSFRTMVTPIIIQALFWLGVAVCVIGGLAGIFAGEPLGGLLTLFLGPLIVRVYCEVLILFFRINTTLTDIRNNTKR